MAYTSDTNDKLARGLAATHGTVVPAKKGKVVLSKSQAAKQAATGKDMGAKGKNFSKIAASAGAKYGSEAAGERVAGAIFQKKRKAGTL